VQRVVDINMLGVMHGHESMIFPSSLASIIMLYSIYADPYPTLITP